MQDAWAEKLSCAIQCQRCDKQLAPTDPRILSVYDHEAICTACKDEEEKTRRLRGGVKTDHRSMSYRHRNAVG